MERWSPQYGTTGSDIDTRRRSFERVQTWSGHPDLCEQQRASDGVANASWITDPRIPVRLARTASVDLGIGLGYDAPQGQYVHTEKRNSRYSQHTTDSDWTNESDLGHSPSLVEDENPVFSPDKENEEGPLVDMDDDPGPMEWKQRMSDFVSGLPNFALGSTTREYTHKRRRIFSDKNSVYHDAVSLEKRAQGLRYRRGTTSSSGSDWSTEQQDQQWVKADSERGSSDNNSTFSRFSSCSSRDSIQHWVDSLDDNENDVAVLPQGSTSRGSRGPSLDYTSSVNQENIPGYGQPLPKKGSTASVDDLTLGADASCITNGTNVPGSGGNGGSVDPPTRRIGPRGRMLERKLTNSQLIEQAQQHRNLQGRRQQLHHMGGSGLSDTPSDYSIRTASSISELLLMRNDPEEILLALGFGGRKKKDHLDRIPSRFLEHSQMKGISVQQFLHRMEEIERGYGFNLNGGLRGLEFVLDRRRTNSIVKQNSTDQEEEEEDKEEAKEQDKQDTMGTTSNKESSVSEEPVTNQPSLEEIYAQRQPRQIRRLLDRWDSSLESRDSGPLLSSRDSTCSENESFDIMSRSGSVDNLRSRDGAKDGSLRNVSPSFPTKEVFQSSTQTSRESSVEQDTTTNVPQASIDGSSDSNGNLNAGALTEEQIKEIREELMLRAQIVRARMMMPSPQLAPVDEESESDSRSTPYRVGSLDTVAEERMADGLKSSPTSENAPLLKEDKPKPSNMLRTMSTPEMELYHPRNPKKSPPQTKNAKTSPASHVLSGDDSNKLKPIAHKVTDRLLKDNGHGGQESFEIEEISSTENQDESGSPSNKTEEKPSEHGTLSRNPSTQSDSSGFADEGDTPTNGTNGKQNNSDESNTMTNTEVQTSFDSTRLDSYDHGSFSSRPSSVDTHVSEHDIRRLAERRESFRKSRGTSIVTTATFSSMDDDAFLPDDIDNATCGRNTPETEDYQEVVERTASSKPRPLRRSGTFPGIPEKSAQHGGPKTIPEILTSLRDSVDKSNLAREDGAASPVLTDRRKRFGSRKMHSVDLERYDARMFDGHASNRVKNSDRCNNARSRELEPACESGGSRSTHDEFQEEPSNNLLSVCEEQIVPSNSESETLCANSAGCKNVQRPHCDPVHRINEPNSTEIVKKEPFPQSLSPTLESWDTSDLSSYSRSPESEPFHNYSPLLSPPPSSSTASVLPDDATLSSNAPPSHRVSWQVTDKAHHLAQHRLSQGSQYPRSICVSELNAKCEPQVTDRLRSSLEMEISLSGKVDIKSLPEDKHLHSQEWSANQVQLPPEEGVENWHKAMSSTTTPTSKKFSQYEVEDIQVLQTSLERYKNDLAVLESKSGLVYGSVDQELTDSDRCEIEALSRLRHQIMGEISTMEGLLQKKLRHVNSPTKASVVSDEAELLAASAENLEIIREMISLLEEQRSMQNFIQDLGNDTQVLQTHMSSRSTDERTSRALSSSSAAGYHNDILVQELLSVKKELEEYRTLAKTELKSAISELKFSIVAEVRREFSQDTKALHYQLQAKDDEIRRLRALLGETDQLQDISRLSLSSNEETQRQKDELMQLKDLLLKKGNTRDGQQPDYQPKKNQGELHQSRNGKR